MNLIAAGVTHVPTSFVNAYLIGEPGGPWAVVDTGLPGFGWKVRAAAVARFGQDSRPVGIFLTHAHSVTLACGHGIPMSGDYVSRELDRFAQQFTPPVRGRYVREPARTDESGVHSLPPKPADPFPYVLGLSAIGLAAAWMLVQQKKRDEIIGNRGM